jgi:hypothetical protein
MALWVGRCSAPDTGSDAHTSGLSRSGYFSEVFHEQAGKSANIASSLEGAGRLIGPFRKCETARFNPDKAASKLVISHIAA